MSQKNLVFAMYPSASISWCGELCTFTIGTVSLNLVNGNNGEANVSVMFLVNGTKEYKTVVVNAAGVTLAPPQNTTYMEIAIQKGTGIPGSNVSIAIS